MISNIVKSKIQKIVQIFFILNVTCIEALAIAPPDFLINSAQNFLQFAGITLAFLVSFLYFIKFHISRLMFFKRKWVNLFIFFIIVITISILSILILSSKSERRWKKNVSTEIKNVVDDLNIKNIIWNKYNRIGSSDDEQLSGKTILNNTFSISAGDYLKIKKLYKTVVVDLRETLSWKRGSIPGSIHIRFADLVSGEWKTLPENDEHIIFLCWVGTSGSLAAEFVAAMGKKNIFCFKNGVKGFKDHPEVGYSGGFPLKFPKIMNKFLSLRTVSRYISEGYVPLDIRPYSKFKTNTMPGAVYLFYEAMTSKELEKTFSSLDPDKKYFAFCDSELTCWLAKVVGLELKTRGLSYAGRYTANKKILEINRKIKEVNVNANIK